MKLQAIGAEEAYLPIRYRDGGGAVQERVFILREHTLAELEQYVRFQLGPNDEIVDLVANMMDGGPEDAIAAPLKAVMEASTALFVWLLRYPQDGGTPPDSAWVDQHVTAPMRQRIVEIQDKLNGMEALEGNARALREQAAARRAARGIVQTSMKSSKDLPPGGVSPR